MGDKLTVYQKPTCSKCQNLLKTLREKGVEFDSVNYYEQPFSFRGLKNLLGQLQMKPQELMRTNEQVYKELKIKDSNLSDNELIKLMVEYPDLIQRPIVIKGKKAVLARPIENLDKIMKGDS